MPPRPGPPRRPPSSHGHCSPRASYLGGSGGSRSGLRAAGCRAGEGAAAASEGSSRAAGERARQATAGRGPSHQRWRGAEGRAEQAGWVGSALRVAVAASTPGRSATRTERSGAERAAAASPPRAFFAPLPALRSCFARAGTSRLRGWRAGSAGHHRPSLGLGRALGRGSLGTAWGQRRTTAPSSVRAVPCAGAPGPAPLAPPGRQVRREVARRQGCAAQPRNGALLGRSARAALGAAPPSRAREEEPPPRGERWSLASECRGPETGAPKKPAADGGRSVAPIPQVALASPARAATSRGKRFAKTPSPHSPFELLAQASGTTPSCSGVYARGAGATSDAA